MSSSVAAQASSWRRGLYRGVRGIWEAVSHVEQPHTRVRSGGLGRSVQRARGRARRRCQRRAVYWSSPARGESRIVNEPRARDWTWPRRRRARPSVRVTVAVGSQTWKRRTLLAVHLQLGALTPSRAVRVCRSPQPLRLRFIAPPRPFNAHLVHRPRTRPPSERSVLPARRVSPASRATPHRDADRI